MKSLIVIAALFASTTGFAASHIVAQLSSVDAQIATVSLTDEGILTVQNREGATTKVKLSEKNQQSLLWASQMLSEADLTTDTHLMVCMMMVAPFSIQNLSVYDATTNKMKMVLSHRSCAISTY